MKRPIRKIRAAAGGLLLGGIAGLGLVSRAGTAESAQGARGATPRFVYASGFQGVGYYPSPGVATTIRQAPAPTFSGASRGQSVGPGVRDWSTGRRGRLHKPWLQPR